MREHNFPGSYRQQLADSLASLERGKSTKGGLFASVSWQEGLTRNLTDMENQTDQTPVKL